MDDGGNAEDEDSRQACEQVLANMKDGVAKGESLVVVFKVTEVRDLRYLF